MKFRLCYIVGLLIFISPNQSFSQIISIDKTDCRVTAADLEKIKTIAKFEVKLYNNLFNTHKNDSLVIDISIVSAAAYRELGKDDAGLHKTLGFYSPGQDHSYILKRPDYLETVIHEISHCILEHNLKNPPRWLTEGIAEFCETMVVENGEVVYSAQPGRVRSIRNQVINSPLKLTGFVGSKDEEWSDLDARTDMYSIAYTMIYFLIKNNPSTLKRILLMMQEGETSFNAIEYSYGGFYKFESDYNTFYRNSLIKPI